MQILDQFQKQAVSTESRHTLITAGPGSGKTRVLIYRIDWLLDKGIDPAQILVLTFTNKAAGEIQDRVVQMLEDKNNKSPSSSSLFIGTIHGLCLKILKNKLDQEFIILDSHDQLEILKTIASRLKIKASPKKVLNHLNNSKATAGEQQKDQPTKDYQKVYGEYRNFLEQNNLYDYNKILSNTVKLLKKDALLRKRYQKRFQYLLVDEYQDINPIQNDILKSLLGQKNYIFAIGDADQSIYGFRNADIKIFLDFPSEFPNSQVIKLQNNYRSSPQIVGASSSLIKHNENRIPCPNISLGENNTLVQIVACRNEKDEAKFIVNEIEKILGGTTHPDTDEQISGQLDTNCSFGDLAILYRKNSFAKFLEHELLHRGFPYQIIGKNSLFDQPEIRTILCLFNFLLSENHFLLKKIRSLPFNLDISKIQNCPIPTQAGNIDIAGLLDNPEIKTLFKNNAAAQENVEKFITLTKRLKCSSLRELMPKLALMSRETYIDKRADCIKLLTLHQAKGLEFDNTFIAGVEDGTIPLINNNDAINLEEERRILYVGMTRAKKNLCLTWAKSRYFYGKRHRQKPSRFLAEIDANFTKTKKFSKKRKQKKQMKLF